MNRSIIVTVVACAAMLSASSTARVGAVQKNANPLLNEPLRLKQGLIAGAPGTNESIAFQRDSVCGAARWSGAVARTGTCTRMPYMLNTLSRSDRPFTDADRKIADTLSSYWANFAVTGDPNGKGRQRWAPVSADSPATMEVGDNFQSIPVASTKERLEFFRRFLTKSGT